MEHLDLTEGDLPEEFDLILGWADEVRGANFGVRANADTGPDADSCAFLRGRGDRAGPHGAHVPR